MKKSKMTEAEKHLMSAIAYLLIALITVWFTIFAIAFSFIRQTFWS